MKWENHFSSKFQFTVFMVANLIKKNTLRLFNKKVVKQKTTKIFQLNLSAFYKKHTLIKLSLILIVLIQKYDDIPFTIN